MDVVCVVVVCVVKNGDSRGGRPRAVLDFTRSAEAQGIANVQSEEYLSAVRIVTRSNDAKYLIML